MKWLNTVGSWLVESGADTFAEFYADDLRGNLFSGCLTFGGFLFAAYTFIVILMKTAVYDSSDYRKIFEEKRKGDSRLQRYEPLRKLSRKLMNAVVLTLVAGVLQLTVGLIPYNWAASICLFAFLVAVIQVGASTRIMAINMQDWLGSLDDGYGDT